MFIEILNEKGRIFRTIAIYPTKGLTLRELARISEVSLGKTSEIVEKMRKEGIINTRKVGNSYLITLNLENEVAIKTKRAINIANFLVSDILKRIEESYPDTAVLFGSFEKGLDTEESDIDLFVVGKVKPELPEEFMGREIDLHFFKGFDEVPDELLESISNGLVLHGFLEVKR